VSFPQGPGAHASNDLAHFRTMQTEFGDDLQIFEKT